MTHVALPPRHGLSLCAGGGGLDMGLELACPGFAASAYVEWEEYPRQTLIAAQRAEYLAPAPIWGDLREFNARPFRGIIDTVVAGYPCQPFSQAGQRKGEDDPRHLWPHVARVIEESDAEWAFLENVAGHLSLGLETVLRELWGMGFTPAAGLFSAEETGAPHERQRVFILAHRQGVGGGSGELSIRTGETQPGSTHGGRELADAPIDGRRLHEGQGAEGRGAADAGGRGATLANTDGRNASAERQQCSRELGLQPEGGGAGGATLDDSHANPDPGGPVGRGDRGCAAKGTGELGRGERVRAEPGRSSGAVDDAPSTRRESARVGPETHSEGRERLPGAGRSELADAGGKGLQGREQSASPEERDGPSAHGSAPQLRGTWLSPPGPGSREAWAEIIANSPHYAPATSLDEVIRLARRLQSAAAGSFKPTSEPALRRMAHGLAARARALRLLGNGVHPLAAAYAFRTLAAAHGLGGMDLEATDREAGTGTDVASVAAE